MNPLNLKVNSETNCDLDANKDFQALLGLVKSNSDETLLETDNIFESLIEEEQKEDEAYLEYEAEIRRRDRREIVESDAVIQKGTFRDQYLRVIILIDTRY